MYMHMQVRRLMCIHMSMQIQTIMHMLLDADVVNACVYMISIRIIARAPTRSPNATNSVCGSCARGPPPVSGCHAARLAAGYPSIGSRRRLIRVAGAKLSSVPGADSRHLPRRALRRLRALLVADTRGEGGALLHLDGRHRRECRRLRVRRRGRALRGPHRGTPPRCAGRRRGRTSLDIGIVMARIVADDCEQLEPGRDLLVSYKVSGPIGFQVRLLLAAIWGVSCMVLTPDSNIYEEDYSDQSADISIWRLRPRGRSLPYVAGGGDVYDLARPPSAQDLFAFEAEGSRVTAYCVFSAAWAPVPRAADRGLGASLVGHGEAAGTHTAAAAACRRGAGLSGTTAAPAAPAAAGAGGGLEHLRDGARLEESLCKPVGASLE